MRLLVVLLSSFLLLVSAEPQYQPYPSYHYPNQYFRSGLHFPGSIADPINGLPADDPRVLLYTLTLTLTTVTSSSTTTVTRTCTTSTAALSTCSAGRRRRGLFPNSLRRRRGLFYDDSEIGAHETEEGTIFLPSSDQQEANQNESVKPSEHRTARQLSGVPVLIQPAFEAESRIRSGRYWLAFGTSTVTTTVTATTTSSLTAICRSTTSYNTCSTSGK